MNRSWTNYLVDSVIAAAFLPCAFTGILFLLPPSWLQALSLGRPGLLFVSYALWHTLHDWSGVAAATGVVAHVGLHYRWIAKMTGRLGRLGGRGAARRPAQRPAAARVSEPAARGAAARAAGFVTPAAAPESAGATQQASAAALRSAERAAARRSAQGAAAASGARPAAGGPAGERRFSRKAFLTGAAATFGVAALGSVGLLSRSSPTLAEIPSAASAGSQSAGIDGSSSAAGQTAAQQTGSSAGAGDTSGAATTTLARVVVDEGACVGCGACLRTCPQGVFSWTNAGVARASSPDQCILCRRCQRVCPAAAITLTA